LTVIGGRDCGDLGYDLGYLRHGSFGRATVRWPGGLRRVAVCALARAARCPVALRSGGLLASDACLSPVAVMVRW